MASKSIGNPNEFHLPDLGEGLEEAELIEWCVKVGQEVKEHDLLVKLETAKALSEIPSPRDGVIAALYGKPGEMIKTGAVLVTFADAHGTAPAKSAPAAAGHAAPSAAASKEATSKPAPTPPSGVRDPAAAKAPRTPEPVTPPAEHAEAEREDAGTVVGKLSGAMEGVGGGKVRAAPAVRRLARDLGVDIEQVAGTGIGGRVTHRDVEAASGNGGAAHDGNRTAPKAHAASDNGGHAQTARPRSPAIAAGPDAIRTPFRGVRRTIAERLRQSVNQAVHFTVMDEADVTALDALRRKLAAASNEKLSFLPFIASAVCHLIASAASPFAKLNSTVDDQNQVIIQHRPVHLGIATDTENGLMVPVIRDAQQLGVLEIGRCITDLAERSRSRSIPAAELMGSTFTLSNFGALAGRFATPIINYPEVAILAIGRARDGVVVRHGMLGVGKLLPLSLTADHRVIDGATAAMALAKIMELLGNPNELMAPVRAE